MCPWGASALPFAACLGLGCVPWGAALALAACPLATCPRGLGNMPTGPWQRAHGALAACLLPMRGQGCYMHWPWLRASCPWRLRWPWLRAHGGCLSLGSMLVAVACPGLDCVAHKFGVISQKIMIFLEKEVICPKEASIVHGVVPRGMPARTPCRIVPHSSQIGSCLFSVFVFLNSFHDFRGGFQQAVWRFELFCIFYDFSYFLASENHKKLNLLNLASKF